MLRKISGIAGCLILVFNYMCLAHPSPNTLIFIDIKDDGVAAELRIPVVELTAALNPGAPETTTALSGSFKASLSRYLQAHIAPLSMNGQKWSVTVGEIMLEDIANPEERNSLQDVIIKIWLSPPVGSSGRQFILHYDVVMHQVITHSALVSIRQDWETGVVAEHPAEVGVISVDPGSNQVFPLTVNLKSNGWWGGFSSMMGLGMRHIAAGTDHLMFLLVLLLPAPLQSSDKKWTRYGGLWYCLRRLLHITLAFTVGHSVTLLLGTIGWVRFPIQPIEVLIALSIFISAMHAIWPVFPQKETYVALGFGLIHGLAFASTISDLHLSPGKMALSILGFNIGIEAMQLVVVALTVPWLMLLSRFHRMYTPIRIIGAILAAVMSVAWMVERITGQSNMLTQIFDRPIAGNLLWF